MGARKQDTLNVMTVDLDWLQEEPVTLRYDFAAATLEAEAPALGLSGQVTGAVTFTRVERDIVAHGTLQTTARGVCARCLEEAEAAVRAAIDELWVRKADERSRPGDGEDIDPDLAHPLIGDMIELSEIFREVLMAETPDRLLCREDCKGLCPQCGANWNQGGCDCAGGGAGSAETPDWKRALKGLKGGD
jgi:uncharacterized protein